MTDRKKPSELRSQQWFGRQDRDGFCHRIQDVERIARRRYVVHTHNRGTMLYGKQRRSHTGVHPVGGQLASDLSQHRLARKPHQQRQSVHAQRF